MFRVFKMIFHHCCPPPLEKILWPPPGEIHYLYAVVNHLEKIFATPVGVKRAFTKNNCLQKSFCLIVSRFYTTSIYYCQSKCAQTDIVFHYFSNSVLMQKYFATAVLHLGCWRFSLSYTYLCKDTPGCWRGSPEIDTVLGRTHTHSSFVTNCGQ